MERKVRTLFALFLAGSLLGYTSHDSFGLEDRVTKIILEYYSK